MYLSGSVFLFDSLKFELLVPLEMDMKMKAALLCTCIILMRMQLGYSGQINHACTDTCMLGILYIYNISLGKIY